MNKILSTHLTPPSFLFSPLAFSFRFPLSFFQTSSLRHPLRCIGLSNSSSIFISNSPSLSYLSHHFALIFFSSLPPTLHTGGTTTLSPLPFLPRKHQLAAALNVLLRFLPRPVCRDPVRFLMFSREARYFVDRTMFDVERMYREKGKRVTTTFGRNLILFAIYG